MKTDSINHNEASKNQRRNFIKTSLAVSLSGATGMSLLAGCTDKKTDTFNDSLKDALVYPLIKSSKKSGIVPVGNVDEKPDITAHYKLLLEVKSGLKDSSGAREMNDSIAEVGRLFNLHIAAGIPKENIDIVVIAHGPVLKSLYNNAFYKQKYQVENPNIALFNELLGAGVKFIVCGQSMFFYKISKEQLLPWLKIGLSAKTVITAYQHREYILNKVEPPQFFDN